MNRYLIIGSGAAGFAAAETIRQQDAGGEIKMLTDDPDGYYSRPGLAYYLTGELPENFLFPAGDSDFARLRVKRILGRATRIDTVNHRVLLHDKTNLPYDRLLIAVGARAAQLKAPGVEFDGVVKLDNLHDARHILKLARKARNAVVVGGGITALELVEGLAANKVKVHYFLRGDRYWSSVLDKTESQIVERRLIDHGVNVHYRTELDTIFGKKGRVNAVCTTDGKIIPCGMVAFAIGVRPRLDLAAASRIEIDRGVLVDEFLQVSAEDVYAAGDTAQVYDPLTGQRILDSLWNPARQQGIYAGLNMAGIQQRYTKEVPVNVTRLAGLTTTIIGSVGSKGSKDSQPETDLDLKYIARGDSETWRGLPDAIAAQTGFEINRLRIMVGKQYLKGALIMGDQKLSQPLQYLIRSKVEITPIRQHLLTPGAPLADILIDHYAAWRATCDPVQ